jgi:[FeFe] hydrogenase (group B1/B3)
MEVTEVVRLRRAVLTFVAQHVWENDLQEHIHDILYTLVREDTPRLRCCVHKERAVLRNRINMALGQQMDITLREAAARAVTEPVHKELPVMDVLPDACDQCPIDKYYVTDLCRHCISHKCMNNCPKKAITIHQDRAFINRNLCIECGRCRQSCPYGAIIEISRPCIRACALDAISPGPDHRSRIDYSKCVQCGNCRGACPFGALDERSMVAQLLTAIKRGEQIVAMVAPSFVGQFGMKVSPGQIVAGLKKLGFAEVMEVAVGADLTATHEAEEMLEKVPSKIKFMTSSCCPAFVNLVRKHFFDNEDNISKTASPMVSCARLIKEKMGYAQTCFIGPCIAKKAEAREYAKDVDYVLTFEELQCIFDGVGIKLDEIAAPVYTTQATSSGIGFPLNKGVQSAMLGVLAKQDVQVKTTYAAGLERCKDQLKEVIAGKEDVQYFEGMACCNGCVDGPGALTQQGLTRVLVTKYASEAKVKTSDDNELVKNNIKDLDLEV